MHCDRKEKLLCVTINVTISKDSIVVGIRGDKRVSKLFYNKPILIKDIIEMIKFYNDGMGK